MSTPIVRSDWLRGRKSHWDDFDLFWSPIERFDIPEFAEQRRVLPTGTPFPGRWENSRTPYLVEPMENMSPSSPIQRTVIAKAAQLGFSAMAENVVCYFIAITPAEILFVSATESLLRNWVTKRLEPAIDSCGAREKIAPRGEVKQHRRTGDLVFQKEFHGGSLNMASAQSASALRADSKRVLIRDEIDGAPAQLHTGEGSWLDVSYVRTNAWGARRKVLDFSTPTTYAESAIWKEYLRGDCRKFSVPCPHCGGYQFLVWQGTDGTGIHWSLKPNGHVDEVWYQCEHCKEKIYNWQKGAMLADGEWKATAISESPNLRSYHINGLYSPVGMLSWEEVVAAYIHAQKEPDGMAGFVNLYLGEPYREEGQRPRIDSVVNLRGKYAAGTVPDDVLFLTMSVDVQQGESQEGTHNPPRLEVEVCGHGSGYRTASIQYYRIPGAIGNPFSGAWYELHKMSLEGVFRYARADGRIFEPRLTLIDSGDGTNIDTVYQFAAGWRNTYPCAGVDMLKKKSDKCDKGDELSRQNFDRYRMTRQRHDANVVLISTNYYKHHIYRSLAIPPNAVGPQVPGSSTFPSDYPASYFEMLTAEDARNDGSFFCPSGRRNEALDLRVYNLAARDLFFDLKIQEIRDEYQKRGMTKAQLLEIRSPTVIAMLEQAVGKVGAGAPN